MDITQLKKEAEAVGLTLLGRIEKTRYYQYRHNSCGHVGKYAPFQLRKHKPFCQGCNLDKQKKEAKERNMTLLSDQLNNKKHLYLFNDCKHKEYFLPYSVSKSRPFCNSCLNEKLHKEAEEKQMTLLDKEPVKSKRFYIFNECGHEKEMKPSELRKYQPICNTCKIERFKKEALAKGLTLISNSETPDCYLYQFNSCSHKKEYKPSVLKSINPTCETCYKDTITKEAKEKGLEILDRISNIQNHRYNYKFIECGHEKEYEPNKLKNIEPCCSICEETYHSKPCKAYIIKIHKGFHSFLKIGISSHTETRIKRYNLKRGYKAEIILEKDFDTRTNALKFEKNFHSVFKHNNLDHNKMKKIMESGFTECYPYKIIENIKNSRFFNQLNHC